MLSFQHEVSEPKSVFLGCQVENDALSAQNSRTKIILLIAQSKMPTLENGRWGRSAPAAPTFTPLRENVRSVPYEISPTQMKVPP